MRLQWTTWLLVAGSVLWLLAWGRLGLLLIVAPAAGVISYASSRFSQKGQNRI